MKRAGVALAVLFWVSPAVADPLVLSCMPNKGYVNAYVWAFAPGGFPPSHLDSFRTLVRIGADEYELEAGHILQQSIREKTVRVHARQPLSAGETAELQIEAGSRNAARNSRRKFISAQAPATDAARRAAPSIEALTNARNAPEPLCRLHVFPSGGGS
ncbi:MAG: hypothetical protein KF794_11560 [Xanthobacteraceae bacterium]|nr:hypothetical protein [Xanthobacteraceae bacterium]QYK44406.1 MAG: hypothetical protein KF794_11560 [Xanthobacteraceae bacterium]